MSDNNMSDSGSEDEVLSRQDEEEVIEDETMEEAAADESGENLIISEDKVEIVSDHAYIYTTRHPRHMLNKRAACRCTERSDFSDICPERRRPYPGQLTATHDQQEPRSRLLRLLYSPSLRSQAAHACPDIQ